ncbi:tape measure protein [Chenggangzhangella methanolivorans]|uniref:tape measure protein n=1 Tax=Chenggangzhangella methanolivorans TaxID=1437009 RepID=UPI00360A2EC7
MAEDLERLVVQLEASLTKYEKEMRRANGIAEREFKKVERSATSMSKKLDGLTSGFGRSLIPSLGAIGAALSIKEVGAYADAWTKAKNSLAVAGVVGQQQAAVLDALFASAQKNAAPIGALADVYGKAAQAQKELGASSAELSQFADGVAVSLRVAGKSSTEAAGALTQLGQLLGSSRVMAEEFNSVNEGARPILMAVAAGLDQAGGSVSKLKQLVNEGAVSNRAFFQAFLKGMPTVQAMAANATQTLEQGWTKVENSLIRYIGKQDQSLGATVILSNALNALADDFDNTADTALKVAGVIAAALVGRAIGGMIASLGVASTAVLRFLAILRTAQGVGLGGLAASMGTLGSAAGPLGAIIAVAATVGLYFASSATAADEAASRASDSIRSLGLSGGSTAGQIRKAADALRDLTEVQRKARMADNEALIAEKAKELGQVSLKDVGVNGRSYANAGALQLANQLRDLNKRAREGRISQESYNKALDDLVEKNPKLLKTAEAYQRIAAEIFAALKNQEALTKAAEAGARVAAPNRRAVEDASMATLERERKDAQQFLDRRKLENSDEREQKIEERAEKIAAALEKAGKIIDRVQIRVQATKEIDAEFSAKQSQSFNGDAIKDYVDRVIKVESGGRTNAKNPDSTATGLGQFIESTWLRLFKKLYPEQFSTMSRGAILELRKNGEISKKMIEEYAKENASALQASGNAVTEANLHLAHFLGSGGANAILKAPRNGLAADYLDRDAVAANPTILGRGKTVQDVLNYADRRANSTRIAAGDLTPEEKSAKDFTDMLRDSDARTAALARETEALNQLTYAREYAAEKARLLEEVEKDGQKATPEMIKSIEDKAAAYAKAQATLETSKTSIQGMREAEQFFAEGATGAFTDIITGAATASEAVRKLAASFAEAGIKALLMGQGPLAGLFGTSGKDGGLGGLFGALFGGFKFAEGGVMTPSGPRHLARYASGGVSDKAAIFGEAGPEAAVPLPDGRRIPVNLRMPAIGKNKPIPRSSSTLNFRTTIDLTGANGDETIKRIAKEQAEAGVAQGLQAYDRNFRNRVEYMNTHEV